MKKRLIYMLGAVMFLCSSCNSTIYPDISRNSSTEILLSSTDSLLVAIFNWATDRFNRWVGSDDDPVGPWYEAALPNREAFCMRDVPHQCIGEEINGHGKQNLI